MIGGRDPLIRAVLVLKAMLALGVLGYYAGWLEFGEHSLVAQEDGGEKGEESSEGERIVDESEADAEGEGSYLDSLLDLPKIDLAEARKDEIGRYLSLVEGKQQKIEERIRHLRKRERQLKRLERVIDDKLGKLEEERLFFAQTIQKEKEVQKERLERLVALYGKMEPKKAAPVFDELDKDLSVALFEGMAQKAVTRILEVMDPQKAKDLTEYFGRIRSGKEYDLLKEMNQSLRKEFADCKVR